MNEPAFPYQNHHGQKLMGMTLRDYFAAKAMQGLLSNSETNRAWGVNENAKYAYEQADAMLKARGEL